MATFVLDELKVNVERTREAALKDIQTQLNEGLFSLWKAYLPRDLSYRAKQWFMQ